jgi:hypothetical protein
MFWKDPKQRAEGIAKKTFDKLRQSSEVYTANDLRKLSQSQKISYLSGFHGVPWSLTLSEFSQLVQSALQEILDYEYGMGVLQAHVTIEYDGEPFYAGPALGTFSAPIKTSWHVT